MIAARLLALALTTTAATAPAASSPPSTAAAATADAATAQGAALTLDEFVDATAAHYPRQRELGLRAAIADRRLDNLDARFRPQLGVVGQAAYHSEVPSLPAAIGPSPAHDQYTLFLDVDQRLWDGGRTTREKALEEAARDVDDAAVAVEFFPWRQQLEAAYFGALASSAELDLLATLVLDLETQLELLDARVRAGVALPGDRAVLAAELEGQRQRITTAAAERRGALDALATLSGIAVADDAVLALPDPLPPSDLIATADAARRGEGVGRPELELARRTVELRQRQMLLSDVATQPMVSAFAQTGLGRPADQDFFQQDITPYFVVGMRVRWPFLDWGVSARERETRGLEQEISGARLATFLDTLSATLMQLARRIEATHQVLESDDRIVGLREVTSQQTAAQLRAGVVTPSTYIIERNAEHRARLTREQHRLRLARDTVEFLTTLGDPS